MVSMHWDALQIMRETLDIYPDVKGLQVRMTRAGTCSRTPVATG